MDRYASHEALARDGAFLRHRAVRASDQARVLVISASPVADPNAAQRALERFARAHASTDHPLFPRPVPLGVDGVGEADGVAFVEDLCRDLRIPGLSALNLKADDISGVIPQAQRASSMQGNPLPLTDDELRGILEAAL